MCHMTIEMVKLVITHWSFELFSLICFLDLGCWGMWWRTNVTMQYWLFVQLWWHIWANMVSSVTSVPFPHWTHSIRRPKYVLTYSSSLYVSMLWQSSLQQFQCWWWCGNMTQDSIRLVFLLEHICFRGSRVSKFIRFCGRRGEPWLMIQNQE